MAPGQRSPWGALRLAVVVGLLGVAIAAAASLQLHRGRRKRRRGTTAARSVPSLAEEIREALGHEGLEDDAPLEDFARAAAWVANASSLSTVAKLTLYGSYKQASAGDCPSERPRGMEASLKWEAWHKHRGSSRAEAMQQYIAALDEVAPAWRSGAAEVAQASQSGPKEAKGMSTGPTVSLLQSIGDPEQLGEVDETPVGLLCAKIAEGETEEVHATLCAFPELAFQADKDGMTPLHWAADRGHMEVARLLLDQVVKHSASSAVLQVNARDNSGDTPLHFAVLTANPDVARLLVSSGADPHAENYEAESPLALVDGAEWRELLLARST